MCALAKKCAGKPMVSCLMGDSTEMCIRDRYYIYKFGEVKNVANALETDYRFKKDRKSVV